MAASNTTGPLLSVVIATRNRVPYAISAIQSILEIPDPRLELVVQDNSEYRNLETYVQANVRDSRFRYHYTPPPFSSIDNFNAAVELATGEYVCLIGDDDGVNPEIMEAAEWARRENLDSLAVRNRVLYIWPGSGVPATPSGQPRDGVFQINSFGGYLIDAAVEEEMRRLIRNGGLYYLDYNLPKLYHGLVHRRCLAAVQKRTGTYFGGLSPDIYASLTIGCVAKRVVITDYPLTISGACGASTGITEGPLRMRCPPLKDAPHFRDRGEYRWCELVPRFYASETIWADSAVAALRAMGRDDLVRQLNLPALAAHCIRANRGAVRLVLRGLFKGLLIVRKNRVIGALGLAWIFLAGWGMRVPRSLWYHGSRVLGRGEATCYLSGLENMVEVSHSLTRYLKENGHSFADCVRCRKR